MASCMRCCNARRRPCIVDDVADPQPHVQEEQVVSSLRSRGVPEQGLSQKLFEVIER